MNRINHAEILRPSSNMYLTKNNEQKLMSLGQEKVIGRYNQIAGDSVRTGNVSQTKRRRI